MPVLKGFRTLLDAYISFTELKHLIERLEVVC